MARAFAVTATHEHDVGKSIGISGRREGKKGNTRYETCSFMGLSRLTVGCSMTAWR